MFEVVIENIDGQWAEIEWGRETFKIPKCLLPSNAKTGDEIRIEIRLKDSHRLRRNSQVSYLTQDSE